MNQPGGKSNCLIDRWPSLCSRLGLWSSVCLRSFRSIYYHLPRSNHWTCWNWLHSAATELPLEVVVVQLSLNVPPEASNWTAFPPDGRAARPRPRFGWWNWLICPELVAVVARLALQAVSQVSPLPGTQLMKLSSLAYLGTKITVLAEF